jgi:hypothetical protein
MAGTIRVHELFSPALRILDASYQFRFRTKEAHGDKARAPPRRNIMIFAERRTVRRILV